MIVVIYIKIFRCSGQALISQFFIGICRWPYLEFASNMPLTGWYTTRKYNKSQPRFYSAARKSWCFVVGVVVCWYFIPLNKNTGRRYVVSCDISWGSIWYCNNDNTKTIFPKIIAHALNSDLNIFIYLSSVIGSELTSFLRKNLVNLWGIH